MAEEEVAALASSQGILDFLKARAGELGKGAGGAALQWVSGELLSAIGLGIGADIKRIKELLDQILELVKDIMEALDKLILEVQFQHLITRSFDAVQRITIAYDGLAMLAKVPDDEERRRNAELKISAILDPNQGARFNLKTISNVLLGKDELGGSGPLIDLFSRRWLPVYLSKQLQPDVPLSTYPGQLDAWLHGLFVIQYMGLAELANARIARGDFGLLQQELDNTIEDMEAQRALLEESIPAFTRTLPDALFDGRRYVVTALNYSTGRLDDSQVMYGSPEGSSTHQSRAVKFRDRHNGNEDEEWQFEKTGKTDTFIMRELSRPYYVTIDGTNLTDQVVVRPRDEATPLRFVMGLTQDPKANLEAKPPELYEPIFAFVDKKDKCLTVKHYGKNEEVLTFAGPEQNAVRVRIAFAGH